MRKWILLALCSIPAFGQVQQSINQLGNTGNWVLAFRWTANGGGGVQQVNARLMGCCDGYFVTQVETIPGTPSPTAGYSVQIQDSAGVDVLGGAAASLSATNPQGFPTSASAPPIQGTFSLVISGQSVPNAAGSVFVFLSKPGTVNAANLMPGRGGGGGGGGSGNWLTLANRLILDIRNFAFIPQVQASSIAPGANTALMIPVPLGVNATDIGHYVCISNGTGTAEPVLITGGSAVSGASSGTITFTAANAHSGNWTIGPCSSGIQEAFDFSPTFTQVVIPAGNTSISGPITMNTEGVCLTGQGSFSSILNWTGPSTGDVFFFDGPDSPGGVGQGNCLAGFQLSGPGGTTPSNSNTAMDINNQAGFYVEKVNIMSFNRGMNFTGAISQRNTIEDVTIFYNSADGITGNTLLVAANFNKVTIGCADEGLGTSNGFHFLQDAGSVINNSYVVNCSNDFLANPGSGQTVQYTQVNNTLFDCGANPSSGNGLALNPAVGGIVDLLIFSQSGSACSQGSGVLVGSTGTVKGLAFNNYRSILNVQFGFEFLGGTDITLTDCLGNGNSALSPGMYDGLMATGVTNLQILGGMYGGYFGFQNTQRYGISLAASVVNPMIEGVTMLANLMQPLSDASTSVRKTIAGNTYTIPTIPSATTFNLGTSDALIVVVTGTTPVTSMASGWDQEQVTIIKPDSGSLPFLGFTLTQNSSLFCTFIDGFNDWYCK